MTDEVRLWLDDIRLAPPGWLLAKTAGQAIAILRTFDVIEASLDYDIIWDPGGNDEGWQDLRTGFAVVKFMEDFKVWPRDGVAVHSSNAEGKARMEEVIRRSGKLIERKGFDPIW